MTWESIHANDFGWTGKLTVQQDGTAVDISTYTTLQFVLKDPDGAITTKIAAFDGDGTDGVLAYTFESGDVDQSGTWVVYARVKKTGVELTSRGLNFYVYDDPS